MTIQITNLDDVNQELVADNLDEIITRLQEDNPSLDLRRGVLKDLLAGYHASLSAAEQQTLARYLSARSLQQIEADPTLADEGVTDDVLSNYRVTRQQGATAQGEITIVVSQNTTVVISEGAIFEADGQQFASDSVFTAKTEAAQINTSTDRLLQQRSDGNWFFTITVTAAEVGTEGNIAKDTFMVPAVPPPNYVTSFATNDFVSGTNTETNTQLLQRLQEGLAARAPSNRTNMKGMLREISDEAYAGNLHSSIVGFGDEEMLRDQHTIWPGSLGGRSDWYIRTVEQLFRLTLQREATLVQIGTRGELSNNCSPGGPNASDIVTVWQFALARDDAPGFYEIRTVRPLGFDEASGSFEILADIRGLDLTGDGFVPDIDTVEEGAYSRYQTTVIKFIDDQVDPTTVAVGDTSAYDVSVAMMPQIGDIQDDLNTRDIRSYGSDVLIKAPVPCFVSLSFTINKQNNVPDPDLDAIKTALAKEVNTIAFLGRLYASQLHDVIQGLLGTTTSAGKIDMFGRLRYPDGTTKYVRDFEVLAIDGPAGQMVSPKTVQFYLDVEDISISIATSVPVPS